jgi:transposase
MTVGVDLAKSVFYAVALDSSGRQVWRRKLSRKQMLTHFGKLSRCRVALEACGGAHWWARQLQAQGHEVVILPPQHVKAYARGQKNDYNDALAIAEACQHGRVRPVVIKGVAEQDRQAVLQLRRQRVAEQTRVVNVTRGLLLEYGMVMSRGKAAFAREVPRILEDAENGLTPGMRELVHRQWLRYQELVEELRWYDRQLQAQVQADPVCQRLMTIPGIGPVVSSVLRGHLGDGKAFRRGRDISASLGLVPRQCTTGGRVQLGGISKRGDGYLRSLLIHGARSVLQQAPRKQDALSCWALAVQQRRGTNKAVVALANKLARIAWAVVVRDEPYRPQPA